MEIILQATTQREGTTALAVLLLGIGFFSLNATQQTASRLTWSLARDNSLIFSTIISRVHPNLGVPVVALLVNFVAILITGLIYVGSSTGKTLSKQFSESPVLTILAFNSLIGSGIVLQQISFALPATLLIYRKRSESFLPPTRAFRLPGVFGWMANILVVVSAFLWTVFFQFPYILPVTGSSMSKTPEWYMEYQLTGLRLPLRCTRGYGHIDSSKLGSAWSEVLPRTTHTSIAYYLCKTNAPNLSIG